MSIPNLGDIAGLLAHSGFPRESIRELRMHTAGSLAPALPIHPSELPGDAPLLANDAGEGTAQLDNQETAVAFKPRETWSKMLKFLKLFRDAPTLSGTASEERI